VFLTRPRAFSQELNLRALLRTFFISQCHISNCSS